MALWLSILRVKAVCAPYPNSERMFLIHAISFPAPIAAIYSVSVVENATMVCNLLYHPINCTPSHYSHKTSSGATNINTIPMRGISVGDKGLRASQITTVGDLVVRSHIGRGVWEHSSVVDQNWCWSEQDRQQSAQCQGVSSWQGIGVIQLHWDRVLWTWSSCPPVSEGPWKWDKANLEGKGVWTGLQSFHTPPMCPKWIGVDEAWVCE